MSNLSINDPGYNAAEATPAHPPSGPALTTAPRRRTARRLSFKQKYAIVGAFLEAGPSIEFSSWAAAVRWVADKTGLELPPMMLRRLQNEVDLKFTVSGIQRVTTVKLRKHVAALTDRVTALEAQLAELKRALGS